MSRDLEFFYYIFINSEDFLNEFDWLALDKTDGGASENSQALARSVMLCCFNLLESFISGIAREHLLINPKLEENIKKKLLDNNSSLRKRILEIPKIVSGKQLPLDENKSPLKELFSDIKHRRDSFVHCDLGNMIVNGDTLKKICLMMFQKKL